MVRRTFGCLVLLHDGAAIGRDRRHGDGGTGATRFLRFSAASMKGASSACFFASRAAWSAFRAGMTLAANSSSESQMCSCLLRPPCWMNTT